MKKQSMRLTETHHGGILATFYRALTETCGQERGVDIFMTAARAYGARRGRRMALRALRDGNPLDMTSYFAYGELMSDSTGLEDPGRYEAAPGAVHERQTDCWWAREFRAMGCQACGVHYCREIDGAIVRGFNPTLGFLCPQNMHLNGSCEFYYHSPEIGRDFMDAYPARLKPGQQVKREMAYHCADVYQMYCQVVDQALPEEAGRLTGAVRETLAGRYGPEFLPALDWYEGTDFERI